MGDMQKKFGHLSNVLRARRLELGVSRRQLANRVGRTEEDIQSIESGQLRYELGTVFLICDELELVFKDLFREAEQTDATVVPFPEARSRQ
ncbi:MAG: helix-turn-helix transcriptional regulator [Pseudomonadota bacterium]